MTRTLICQTVINSHVWDIYGVSGDGGTAVWAPDGRTPRPSYIEVGMDTHFCNVISTVCHEVGELTLNELQCAYDPSHAFRATNATIHFMLDHEQWDEVSCAIGYAMAKMYAPIKKAHRDYMKSQKEAIK